MRRQLRNLGITRSAKMTPLLRSVLIFIIIVSTGTLAFSQAKPDKYALLIAVNAYDYDYFSSLRYPEADAKAIGQFLTDAGYQVDLVLGPDASKARIDEKLASLNRRGSNKGVVFVGVFGHGIEFESNNMSYFCPFDSAGRIARDKDNKELFAGVPGGPIGKRLIEPDPSTMVSIDDLMTSLESSKAANRILIADCCRDDPNRARSRSFGSSLRTNSLPINTVVLFACAANQRAMEHDAWQHGALTKCLLDEFHQSGDGKQVTMVNIAPKMIDAVSQLVKSVDEHSEQTPRFLATGSADLLFEGRGLPLDRIGIKEAQQRVAHCRELLAKQHLNVTESSAVRNNQYSEAKSLQMRAWAYAKLGEEKAMLDTCVELLRQHQSHFIPEILGRSLGVLVRQKRGLVDLKSVEEKLLSLTNTLKTIGGVAKPPNTANGIWLYLNDENYLSGTTRKDEFKPLVTARAACELVLSRPDYTRLTTLAYDPSILSSDREGKLREKLRRIAGGDADNSTDSLLAASILGDSRKVLELVHKAELSHASVSVAPFVHHHQIDTVHEIVSAKESDPNYLLVALNTLLNSAKGAEASELLKKLGIPKLNNRAFKVLACNYVRDSSLPACSGKMSTYGSHASSILPEFAWIFGRMNDPAAFETVVASVDDKAKLRDAEIHFAAGLLEDIPADILTEATR